MIWSGHDPLMLDEFSGDPQELAYVHAYRKAINDLKAKQKVSYGEADDVEETGGAASSNPGGKGSKKGRGGKKKDGGGAAEQ